MTATPIFSWIFFKKVLITGPDFFAAAISKKLTLEIMKFLHEHLRSFQLIREFSPIP